MNLESPRYVNMKPLKQFAAKKLQDTPLRGVLLLEDDKLDVHSFLVKLPTWLQLVRWTPRKGANRISYQIIETGRC